MNTTLRRTLALSSILVTLVACGSDSDSDASSASSATPASAAAPTTEAPATSAAAPASSETEAPTITIADAWARTSPMNSAAGAVYLSITAASDDELVGASVPASIAGTVEIHETVMAGSGMASDTTMAGGMASETTVGGMASETTAGGMSGATVPSQPAMQMRPVASIALPAGTLVELKPGGYHIMLLELAAPLEVGSDIAVTLTFAKAPPVTVQVPVRDDMP